MSEKEGVTEQKRTRLLSSSHKQSAHNGLDLRFPVKVGKGSFTDHSSMSDGGG